MEQAKAGVRALHARPTPIRRPAPIRVFLVDPQALMRQGLRMMLSAERDMQVVGEADGGRQAIDEVAGLAPDVVLMDIMMPGGAGGEVIRALKRRSPAVQILVLTAYANQDLFHEAAEAGAVGYVLKDISPANLANAVRAVHTGATMINPILARQMVEGLVRRRDGAASDVRPLHRLTQRELDILVEVAQGRTDKEIAAKLFLSESRIKNVLRALYRRLALRNRAHAAAFAVRRGLL